MQTNDHVDVTVDPCILKQQSMLLKVTECLYKYITSQVEKYYLECNCSPSYQVHCLATTTPSGSSYAVDLNNGREFSIFTLESMQL